MQPDHPMSGNSERVRTQWVLASITAAFVLLAVLFVADLWGRPPRLPKIPPVDAEFLNTAPWRQGYADLVKAKEDLSDFDCYACHEKSKPPVIQFDEQLRIILPKEHENIQLAHGSHNRNNVCYNCHNEQNLLTFQARDGRELKFQDSTALCGSCHGPTLRDFDAGVHGRTNGFWDRRQGEAHRLECVNCHDPHAPRIPSRAPAPPPHPLRPQHASQLPAPH
jgi:uncharacterized CHY-type Zn-finger protein